MAWICRSGVITGTTPDIMLVLAVTTPLVVVVGAVVTTPLVVVVVGAVVTTPLVVVVVVGAVVATPLAMVVVKVALMAVHFWGGIRSGRGHFASSHVKGVCFLSLQEIKSIIL